MTDQDLLQMLKANLEKRNSLGDDYLAQLIQAAKAEISREGITLSSDAYSSDEANVIVMYAAYLYRRRNAAAGDYRNAELNPQGMPYMLRLALNNRIFAESMS